MASFGLPGGAELLIVLFILGAGLVLPWMAMYRIAKRVGYTEGTSHLWGLGFAFLGWLGLLIFSLVEWPVPQAEALAGPAAGGA